VTEILERQEEQTRKSFIGERRTRVEDERLVRGLGKYVDDVDPPRLVHMALVRCPYPRARIVSIDASAARALPGVLEVLLPEDVLARTDPITILRPIPDAPAIMPRALPDGEALYEGQPIASVCAVSRYVAEDAAQLIDVEYEPLPFVVDVLQAAEDDAPVLHESMGTNVLVTNPRGDGDWDGAFEACDSRCRRHLSINRVSGSRWRPARSLRTGHRA
jgi:carbon-monoxide dehydrogenase large subunit